MKQKAKKLLLLIVIISLPNLAPRYSTAEPECIRNPPRSQPIEIFIDLIISNRTQSLDRECMQRVSDAQADIRYRQTSQGDKAFRTLSKYHKRVQSDNTWGSASEYKSVGAERKENLENQRQPYVIDSTDGYTTIKE